MAHYTFVIKDYTELGIDTRDHPESIDIFTDFGRDVTHWVTTGYIPVGDVHISKVDKPNGRTVWRLRQAIYRA